MTRSTRINPPTLVRVRAFTLIELLVVVAILALLIAILLPSLGKAREQARIAVCGTHMKQIAAAVLMYVDQNGGAMIPAETATSAGVSSPQFWATDLAIQGYLPSKNNIDPSGNTAIPNALTVFNCPDGLFTENTVAAAGGNATFTGGFPRSDFNRYYLRQSVVSPTAGDVTAFTWYALNAHNISTQSNIGHGGAGSGQGGPCPFVQFNKVPAPGTLADPQGYRRHISMVAAPSRLVLAVEASAASWDANGNSAPSAPDALAPTVGHPQRLSGRHGDAMNSNYDGYTNFAFFDGHVAKYSTVPYSQTQWAYEIAGPGGGADNIRSPVQETLFYLDEQ